MRRLVTGRYDKRSHTLRRRFFALECQSDEALWDVRVGLPEPAVSKSLSPLIVAYVEYVLYEFAKCVVFIVKRDVVTPGHRRLRRRNHVFTRLYDGSECPEASCDDCAS